MATRIMILRRERESGKQVFYIWRVSDSKKIKFSRWPWPNVSGGQYGNCANCVEIGVYVWANRHDANADPPRLLRREPVMHRDYDGSKSGTPRTSSLKSRHSENR